MFYDLLSEYSIKYCRSAGEINLVEALAKHYSPLDGREIDPLSEVTVSVGATEGLFAGVRLYLLLIKTRYSFCIFFL